MIEFKDPPPTTGQKWKPVVRALKEKPGMWALVLSDARISIPNAIRNQAIKDLRRVAGIEIKTRNEKRTKPRTCDVYLRYNPNLDESLSGHERRKAIAVFKENTGEE